MVNLRQRVRGAATPQMESTQLCPLYQPGGPVVIGMAEAQSMGAGSFQKDAAAAAMPGTGDVKVPIDAFQ